jgi:hypothetical protein
MKEGDKKAYVLKMIQIHLLSIVIFLPIYLLLVRGLSIQAGAVVGSNQTFTLTNYLTMLTGQDNYLRSISITRNLFFLPGILLSFVMILLAIRNFDFKNQANAFLLIMFLPFFVLLVYFNYLSINPFNNSIGNTWSIYKLIQWSYWIIILLLGINLTRYLKPKLIVICVLIMFPSYFGNLKQIIHYDWLTTTAAVGNNKPFNEYTKVIEKGKNYAPANLFFPRIHPMEPYFLVTLLKGKSKAIYNNLKESQLAFYYPEMSKPNLSGSHYNWLHARMKTYSDTTSLTTIANYLIYPQKANVLYFPTLNSDSLNININDPIEAYFIAPKKGQVSSNLSINTNNPGRLIVQQGSEELISIQIDKPGKTDYLLELNNGYSKIIFSFESDKPHLEKEAYISDVKFFLP